MCAVHIDSRNSDGFHLPPRTIFSTTSSVEVQETRSARTEGRGAMSMPSGRDSAWGDVTHIKAPQRITQLRKRKKNPKIKKRLGGGCVEESVCAYATRQSLKDKRLSCLDSRITMQRKPLIYHNMILYNVVAVTICIVNPGVEAARRCSLTERVTNPHVTKCSHQQSTSQTQNFTYQSSVPQCQHCSHRPNIHTSFMY